MIRHTVAEAWLLFRARVLVSTVLALALAVPICLAGVTLAAEKWLRPFTRLSEERSVVAVLLHPTMDDPMRLQWIAEQEALHPEWQLTLVEPERLAERLSSWFPYMAELFHGRDASSFLPALVEIGTVDVSSLEVLDNASEVVAMGPRTSVHRLIGDVAGDLAFIFGTLTAILLAAAVALTSIWVHLEIFRHADELTIMRLIGATEWAIRGPFLVAVVIPGVVAAGLSIAGTVVGIGALAELATAVGLPGVELSSWIIFLQIGVGILLPLFAGMLTLARHARLEVDA